MAAGDRNVSGLAGGSGWRQRTLASSVRCQGVGLHTGAGASLALHPAEAGSGIIFRRTDAGSGGATVVAHCRNVSDTRLCTTLANRDGVTVMTVEHLLAALAGAGIDNVLVEIEGPEVPAMDGSAAPFMDLIAAAGVAALDTPRRALLVTREIRVGDPWRGAAMLPHSRFSIDMEIAFAAPAIGRQRLVYDPGSEDFASRIAPARTFAQLADVEAMRSAGLARGGSLGNAVVVSGARVLNAEGLRFPDEFVRHKILDSIGDLALAGGPILGRFVGRRSGHALNIALLRRLLAHSGAWRWADSAAHHQAMSASRSRSAMASIL